MKRQQWQIETPCLPWCRSWIAQDLRVCIVTKDSEYAIEMVKYNKGMSMNDATILWMINDLCIHGNARQGDCGRLNLP